MKKNKWLILIIIAISVVLLLSSTKIVLLLTGYNLEKKKLDNTPLSEDIVFWLEKFSEQKGVLNVISFEGWAINKNYAPDAERNVSLILRAEEYYYELPGDCYKRQDVANHFSELGLNPDGLGFQGSFSTIPIKNGKYELYIKVWESNKEPGLHSMNRYFVKSKNKLTEVAEKDW